MWYPTCAMADEPTRFTAAQLRALAALTGEWSDIRRPLTQAIYSLSLFRPDLVDIKFFPFRRDPPQTSQARLTAAGLVEKGRVPKKPAKPRRTASSHTGGPPIVRFYR